MAQQNGWASLGNAIAGGNKLNGELMYDQGEALGARTQDALAQARARIDENNAKENLDSTLAPLVTDPKTRAGIVSMVQSGRSPADLFNSLKTNQEIGLRGQVADPTTADPQVARNLLALGQPAEILHPVGEFQYANKLHPDQGVQATDLGTQLAAASMNQKSASAANSTSEAALHADQIAHPEKYRVGVPSANGPGVIPSDGSYQHEDVAQLIAAGAMPMPSGRALVMMGGDGLVQRVRQINPTFKGQTYGANARTEGDLAGGVSGRQTDSINRVAGHLDVFEGLMKQLNNGELQPSNQIKNYLTTLTGGAAPSNTALAAQVLGTEIVKSMAQSGAGSKEERVDLAQQFANAKSPPQFQGAIDTARDLVRQQALAINQRATVHGVPDYLKNSIMPAARKRLQLGEFDPEFAKPGAAATTPDNDPLGIRK